MKNAILVAMTEEYASEISRWEYEPPYDVYSFKGHPNGYLFEKEIWGKEQFCLIKDGDVIGQVACQSDGDDLWVGWAQNPKLCGKGNGHLFIVRCVEEIRREKNHYGRILLRVAASNLRAVKAYKKSGFIPVDTVSDEIAYSNRMEDFFIMEIK